MPIATRADYVSYLEADYAALGRPRGVHWFTHEVWRFQRTLRWFEYCLNTNSIWKIYAHWAWRRKGMKLGFTIPPNTFGPGLSIAHYGTIVVNPNARIGANCRIHVGVNIGTAKGTEAQAPTIGDGSYIGPGAKIFGPVVLGNDVTIGANAVVNRSFPDGECTLVGIPARPVQSA